MATSRDCASFFLLSSFVSFVSCCSYLPTTHCYHHHYVLTHMAFMVLSRSPLFFLFLSFLRPSFHLFFFYMTGDAICM
jgi:hypothetical protein